MGSDAMKRPSAPAALYEAINAHDPHAVLAAMAEDFVGEVSAGMPLGVGGRHDGREAMLAEVWGLVFAAYDVSLDVEHLHEASEAITIAIGHYRGSERAGGRRFEARFAHVLETKDGLVSRLEQITDTAQWPRSEGRNPR